MIRHSIQYIPANPKKEMIMTRLGYQKNITVISPEDRKFLEDTINDGLLYCQPYGVFGFLDITENDGNTVELEGGLQVTSSRLAAMLIQSSRLALMFATAGGEISERISREIRTGNAAAGVIMDAVASQVADAAVTWLVDFLNRKLAREGQILTKRRYSPGYGDLPLTYQKMFFDILSLDTLGIRLTERYMLDPEKSVIALSGVERINVHEK